ncbi:MAG: HXXEE domain-containing protein [Anaerolineales bacterium]|nr:HXXEE domain-containing protein [Anaerolineales bacterium]MCB9004149.1 HXXEE domain-containing protein [Ardenticatenaceae bacterium]
MPPISLWLFFPLAITLHNLEEAIWLPKWSKNAKPFHKPVEEHEFYFAVLFVTILAYLFTFLAVAWPSSWLWTRIFYGFMGAMILNTFIPHLAATIMLRKYSPGLATGLCLLVPMNTVILHQSVVLGHINLLDLALSILVVSLTLLSLLPVFFKLGRRLANQVTQ